MTSDLHPSKRREEQHFLSIVPNACISLQLCSPVAPTSTCCGMSALWKSNTRDFSLVDYKYEVLGKVFLLHLTLCTGHDSTDSTALHFQQVHGCAGSEERGIKIKFPLIFFLLQGYFIFFLCSQKVLIYLKFWFLFFSCMNVKQSRAGAFPANTEQSYKVPTHSKGTWEMAERHNENGSPA